MANYKVAKLCFLDGKRRRVGDIVKFEGKAPSYLEAVKTEPLPKKKAKAKK